MAKQYDKRVRGPYFKVGDWCFLLELWPKHKYADTWRGPYKVVKVLNKHNYVVEVEGKEKVVSISKMKPYRFNKHSDVASKPDKVTIPESKQLMRQSPRREDSSSDDNSVILMWEAPPQRRSRRLADKEKKSEKTLIQPSSGATTASEGDVTEVSNVDPAVSPTNTEHESAQDSTLRPDNLETSGISDQEFVDAQEAFDDAEFDRQAEGSAGDARPPPETSDSSAAGRSNIPGPSRSGLHFRGSDTPISLRDITDQERFRRNHSSNTQSGTTRSGAAFRREATTSTSGAPTSTAKKSKKDGKKSTSAAVPETSERNTGGYSLRPKPKATKRFGFLSKPGSSKTSTDK